MRGVQVRMRRAHAAWILAAVVACGARELPVVHDARPAQDPVPTVTPAAPPASTTSAAPAVVDDGYEAARAHVEKGDAELDAATRDPGRLANAKPHYEAALTPPDNPLYGYAAYKLAYVYWNLSDFDHALVMFKKAIDFGAAHPEVQGAKTIRDAALRDVVPVFAIRGDPARAYDFFRMLSHDDARALDMLDKLGRTYEDTGKLSDAKAIRAELKRRDPSRP